MAVVQHRSRRKASGGRYHSFRKKRVFELGNRPAMTHIGERKSKIVRARAGIIKQKLLQNNTANLLGKDGKCQKVKILNVIESSANPNFVRRNILTKGSTIETDKGKARITSRPGQEGTVNAVLI